MWQLMDSGNIGHNVVSIYTDIHEKKESIIKFGSWDITGLKKGENLTILKTAD